MVIIKKERENNRFLFLLSGYQDSNLGPPAPKAGALTGLRYTPFARNTQSNIDWISAEREGFEPPEPLSSTVFKTAAIDHSAISPKFLISLTNRSLSIAMQR